MNANLQRKYEGTKAYHQAGFKASILYEFYTKSKLLVCRIVYANVKIVVNTNFCIRFQLS